MDLVNSIAGNTVDLVKNQSSGFITFLISRNVLQTATGLLLGSQFNMIIKTFIETIISPILNVLFLSETTKFEDYTFTIKGVRIEIGRFINDLISVFTVALTVYFIWKLLRVE